MLIVSSFATAQTEDAGVKYLGSDQVFKGYVDFSTMYFGVQLKKTKVFYWDQSKGGKRIVFRGTEVDSVLIP